MALDDNKIKSFAEKARGENKQATQSPNLFDSVTINIILASIYSWRTFPDYSLKSCLCQFKISLFC